MAGDDPCSQPSFFLLGVKNEPFPSNRSTPGSVMMLFLASFFFLGVAEEVVSLSEVEQRRGVL